MGIPAIVPDLAKPVLKIQTNFGLEKLLGCSQLIQPMGELAPDPLDALVYVNVLNVNS